MSEKIQNYNSKTNVDVRNTRDIMICLKRKNYNRPLGICRNA